MKDSPRASGPPRWLLRATAPVASAFSGHRWFPLWAIVHHRGRKSGAHYSTPVAVIPTTPPDLVMIGLPWGPHTNWARNVLAAGAATLTWKGADHDLTGPRLIGPAEAASLSKPVFRPIVARFPAAILLERQESRAGSRGIGRAVAAEDPRV